MKDLTCDHAKGETIFLTKVYKGGQLLGFYSHSPWGTTRDQEQGWQLIDSNTLEILEEIQTRSMGRHTGGFIDWYVEIGKIYGKSQHLVNEAGDRVWKITEVDK